MCELRRVRTEPVHGMVRMNLWKERERELKTMNKLTARNRGEERGRGNR
jgi:hypothetical protein